MGRIITWLVLSIVTLLLAGCQQEPETVEANVGPMVLDYALMAEPRLLDPALAVDEGSLEIIVQLFEGLTAFDPESGQVEPALAEAWDRSEDGLTYTFKMRENALWVDQDGVARGVVTAEDVAQSIKRVCRPDMPAPLKHVLFVIKGCRDVSTSEGIPDLDSIGVRAIDRFTVEFTLSRKVAYFPILLSLPVARPVPVEMVQTLGEGWTEPGQLLTNGPFLLAGWDRGATVTLERNPTYYGMAEVGLERVTGHLVTDPLVALQMYRDDELDMIPVPASTIAQVRADEGLREEMVQVLQPCTYAYGFTLVKPPVDNARVRRALSLAIDRERIVSEATQGGRVVARHFTPPVIFGAPPADYLGVTRDEEAARALLAEAGYPEGQGFPLITLMHPVGAEHERVAAAVAAGWKQVLNIETQLQPVPATDYLEAIKPTTSLEAMPHLWVLSWCGDYPDASNWSETVFALEPRPESGRPASRTSAEWVNVQPAANNARRTVGRFDELVGQAAQEQEPPMRRELYAEAEQLLTVEEAIVAPIYHAATDYLVKPWVESRSFPIRERSFKAWRVNMRDKLGPEDEVE